MIDICNPDNCEVVTIGLKDEILAPVYMNGRWAVEGIRLRSDSENKASEESK